MKWSVSSLLAALLLGACSHPGTIPSPVPQPPPTHIIGIVAQAPDQSRIPGAKVQLHETPGPSGYISQTTDSIGLALFVVDAALVDSDVIIDATGYNTFTSHVDVVDRMNYFYTLTPTPPVWPEPVARSPLTLEPNSDGLICHSTPLPNLNVPTGSNPRFWRGDAWGVVVPNLPFVSGGSSKHPERVLTWFFDRWSPDWQHQILLAYRLRGYTHFALSWPDSRDGNGQSVQQFVNTATLVHTAIPYVPVFLTSKLYDPADASAATRMAAVTPVMDALLAAKVTNIFVVGWELDSFNDGQKLEDFIDALDARYHGQIDLYVHFTTYKTSWQPDGQPRAQFWQHSQGKLVGLLYQGNQNDSCALMQAHFADALTDASGIRQTGAILIPWELQAMNSFDGDHPTEDEANARSWELLNTPGFAINASGFGEGGRYPDGTPTLPKY